MGMLGSTKSVTFSQNLLLAHTLKYGALYMSWQAVARLLRGPYDPRRYYLMQKIININSFHGHVQEDIISYRKL